MTDGVRPTPNAVRDLIRAILTGDVMAALWGVADRGLPVPVHSVDVALLALPRAESLDRHAIVISALIHDMGKLAGTSERGLSHSALMRQQPREPTRVAMDALATAELDASVALPVETRRHIEHIVISHHGRYGLVQPETAEARLVAECDELSATRHRLCPIDANDILPLLVEGYSWVGAARVLKVSRELIKKRLADALAVTGARDWSNLVPLWRRDGAVPIGPPEFAARIQRVKTVRRLAMRPADELASILLGDGIPASTAVESRA